MITSGTACELPNALLVRFREMHLKCGVRLVFGVKVTPIVTRSGEQARAFENGQDETDASRVLNVFVGSCSNTSDLTNVDLRLFNGIVRIPATQCVSKLFRLSLSSLGVIMPYCSRRCVAEHGETGHIDISKRDVFEDSQVDG